MLHQIGVGALGPVFRTYEPTRDRLVAVKVFRLDITPEQAQALADELSVATQAGLFHPSIVEPIAAGVEGTVAYRAEEYVAAESLDVAMRHYAPAPADRVLPFISQLAAALDFARLNGIGHGALHPRDIFVTPEEARATGFGVVEALERVGLRAPVRRPYSAPERVAGESWGTPADVFSLGAIAYELFTARRPAGVGSAIGDLAGASVDHASQIRAVLVRAMEENPASRFATAMAFSAALEGASRGQAMPAAAVTVPAAAAVAPARRILTPEPPQPAPPVEPEIDDITAEREEDDAFFALESEQESSRALEKPPARDLFDIEAVEDLALDPEPDRFKNEFDPLVLDELAPPARFASTSDPVDPPRQRAFETEADVDDDVPAYVPPRRSIDYVSEDQNGGGYPPQRRTLPKMLLFLLGIVVGLGAGVGIGYGLGSRSAATSAPADADADAGAKDPAATAAAEGSKAYSEQAVTEPKPPSEAPPIPGDAPPPSAPIRSAEPAAPPPSAPAVTSGRLIVRSVPANAGVTVDGTWRGRTPLTIDKLPLGTHEVRIVQPGYTVARQGIALTANAPARTLSFRLERDAAAPVAPVAPPAPSASAKAPADRPAPPPATPSEAKGPGSLYVDSRPRGATVFLDGKQIGVTPATIPDVTPGPHVIRIELLDHRVWTANSQVLPGQQTRVTGSLERIR